MVESEDRLVTHCRVWWEGAERGGGWGDTDQRVSERDGMEGVGDESLWWYMYMCMCMYVYVYVYAYEPYLCGCCIKT